MHTSGMSFVHLPVSIDGQPATHKILNQQKCKLRDPRETEMAVPIQPAILQVDRVFQQGVGRLSGNIFCPADPSLSCNGNGAQTDGNTVWCQWTPVAYITVNISTVGSTQNGGELDTAHGVFSGSRAADNADSRR